MREIAVHADVVCPFTHVGLRRVVAERRARGLDGRVALVVHAWPLECVNGEPLDPAFVAQEVEALRRAVAPDLFTGFDPATFPTTSIPALALTATAYERSTEVGEAAALALRDALFEHGRDIGDPDVVAEVAAGLGLPAAGDEALVWADYEAGKRLGVTGSPYFRAGGSTFFCPALDVSHDESGFHVGFVPERFAGFCDTIFDGC